MEGTRDEAFKMADRVAASLQDAFGRFVPGVLIQGGSCRVRNISSRYSRERLFVREAPRRDRFQFYLINVERTSR